MCCPQQNKTCLGGQSEPHVVCEAGKSLLAIGNVLTQRTLLLTTTKHVMSCSKKSTFQE